jgi:uncharacterized LabA/DUF88 family protein
LPDTLNKIAVFIDFDNIEIGVRSTMGLPFDVGVVLDALKERGEVVSKIAYSDWKRAGDYSRVLSQHAIKMVQRNLTPGGDKNGADINLALDALEMAFTHAHINTFVIVGGDSDFISLVEKLKQYDRKIFVVGGRQFTSQIMQKNCHEFIAYENLVGGPRKAAAATRGRAAAQTPISQVVPLVRRALGLLSEREVSPQLGLLKSTLLQLDSTFSEKSYGAGTFLDFAEKLAAAGVVNIRRAGHNLLVDLRADASAPPADEVDSDTGGADVPADETPRPAADPERFADGIREVRRLFQSAPTPPRFPMYIRNVKQFLRSVEPGFDERRYGFSGLVELLRACQKDGLLRLERGRQGVLRVFAGGTMPAAQTPVARPEPVRSDPPVVEAEVVAPSEAVAVEAPAGAAGPKRRRRKTSTAGAKKGAAATKPPAQRKPRARKAPSPPTA